MQLQTTRYQTQSLLHMCHQQLPSSLYILILCPLRHLLLPTQPNHLQLLTFQLDLHLLTHHLLTLTLLHLPIHLPLHHHHTLPHLHIHNHHTLLHLPIHHHHIHTHLSLHIPQLQLIHHRHINRLQLILLEYTLHRHTEMDLLHSEARRQHDVVILWMVRNFA